MKRNADSADDIDTILAQMKDEEKAVKSKNKTAKTEDLAKDEAYQRQQGLQRRLGSSNKGFKLLQSMAGMSAGSELETFDRDPLDVTLGQRRQGLGSISARTEDSAPVDVDHFRAGLARRRELQRIKGDLQKALAIKRELEERNGIAVVEDPTVDDAQVEHAFQGVNEYLRNTFKYCLWCGCSYESVEMLKEECPGPLFDLH
jgi:monoamine oxidase